METRYTELVKKTVLISLILLLILGLVLIFFYGFNLLLLLFTGMLLSVFFHSLSSFIHNHTRISEKLSLPIAIVCVLGILYLLVSFVGNAISQQANELIQQAPKIIERFQQYTEDIPWAQYMINTNPSLEENAPTLLKYGQKIFKSTFGLFGDMYTIVFFGLFFMLSPQTYQKGLVELVPNKYKSRTEGIIHQLGKRLETWLKAQFINMVFIFVLTAIGMFFLGINLWLILALIAGILSFIPNLGPVLALIPATLVGLLDSPMTALYIIGIFTLVQAIESALLGPYVQKNMLSLAPALVLFTQLFFGSFAGALGVLLATPILIILVHLITELYIKDLSSTK